MEADLRPLKVLALCGSLRKASINAALLRAAARCRRGWSGRAPSRSSDFPAFPLR
jgi:hypothetical protein